MEKKMSSERQGVLSHAADLHFTVGSLSCCRLGTNSLWTGANLWATL